MLSQDSARLVLAVVFLLIVGVPGYIARIRDERTIAISTGGADAASRAQVSFDALKPFVPLKGRIGYLQPSDWPRAEAIFLFYLAEYSLTPRLVVFGTDADFVIAVPQTGVQADAAASDPRLNGFALVHRFQDGLLLFRRTS